MRWGILCAGVVALLLAVAVPAPPQTTPPPPPPPAVSSDDLARRATQAREASRLDEAAQLYRQAVRLRPGWGDGWWYLGTMAYDADRLAECRDAFRRLASLRPKVGAVWALRGLCEFGLREYGVARQHLEKALALGFPKNDLIGPVALYHQALLLIQDSAFDLAIGPLTQLVHAQGESPELVAACGLVLLRRPLLPDSIPSPERALVVEAGGAYCAHLARKGELACRLFEALLRRYPEERHLHYGYGLALAQRGLPEAAAEFRREIELHPDHVLAHVELAFTLLTRGASKEARGPAEAAVKLAPGLFAAHLALGRALTATGEATRGVEELEAAARLAPDVPEVHFALARAYAQAGRPQDAARANEVFRALDAARRRGTAAGPPPP